MAVWGEQRARLCWLPRRWSRSEEVLPWPAQKKTGQTPVELQKTTLSQPLPVAAPHRFSLPSHPCILTWFSPSLSTGPDLSHSQFLIIVFTQKTMLTSKHLSKDYGLLLTLLSRLLFWKWSLFLFFLCFLVDQSRILKRLVWNASKGLAVESPLGYAALLLEASHWDLGSGSQFPLRTGGLGTRHGLQINSLWVRTRDEIPGVVSEMLADCCCSVALDESWWTTRLQQGVWATEGDADQHPNWPWSNSECWHVPFIIQEAHK